MKKGFTLIELLAVIFILGIIAVIAVVSVQGYIEETRIQTTKTGALSVLEGAQNYYLNVITEEGRFDSVRLDITESRELLDLKGELPDSGYVIIDADSKATVYYVKYDYCIIVDSINMDIYMTQDLTECEDLTEIKPNFLLEDVVLDGVDDWYDTNYSLFDTPKDFTIITSFMFTGSANISIPSTLFHTMYEGTPYPGIAFDHQYTKGRIAANINVKEPMVTDLSNNKHILAIKRDTTTSKFYYYVFDSSGEVVVGNMTNNVSTKAFEQNLIVGAYQLIDGTKGRFFKGNIYNFSLYMQSLDDEEIISKMKSLKN